VKAKPRQNRLYECVGGPLCGAKMPSHDGFAYVDEDGCSHYYRKIKVVRNDHSAMATFYHYFGTSKRWASKAHPYLLPGERVFRPVT
jgi:hypothetical protein